MRKICLFHPRLLPPRDYGGVERAVVWLTRGLVEAGHEVHVAALPGSQLPRGATLLEVAPHEMSLEKFRRRIPPSCDILHLFGPESDLLLDDLGIAHLTTIQGNGKPGEVFSRNSVFVSQDHARRHHAEAFVHNGIDPEEFEFGGKKSGMLFLSKTSWAVKNLAGAMKICLRAGVKLRISGGHRPVGLRLEAQLRAMMGQMQWCGPVSGKKKAGLLREAGAFIFPILWSEPFGIVLPEAWMSGTPVFGSALGSLPELIRPEVGLLLPPPVSEGAVDEWVDAIRSRAHRGGAFGFDPLACREYAMKHFHYRNMTEKYLHYYEKVILNEPIHSERPHSGP